jgi:hypothetical protein
MAKLTAKVFEDYLKDNPLGNKTRLYNHFDGLGFSQGDFLFAFYYFQVTGKICYIPKTDIYVYCPYLSKLLSMKNRSILRGLANNK